MVAAARDSRSTVLVVDDNPNNRDLIQRRLERAGYDVMSAEDGQTALDLVERHDIDLLVLDIMMPGLTGVDVLRRLRTEHSSVQLPIIMATAKNQSEDVVEALDAGANDYVTKPLDFAILLARVHAHLRAKHAAAVEMEDEVRYSFGDMKPGLVLAEKYRLEEQVGRGNFGVLFRATHLSFRQPVALKILQANLSDQDGESLARFQQEGISAFRLKHPNAVSVLDFCVAHGLAFLVMELLEGENLEQRLARKRWLPERVCAEYLDQICEVLAEGHSLGIIHRDIKPANIFLHDTPRGEMVKVLDFGIAKLVGEAAAGQHLTVDEGVLGTPAYMAPERLNGKDYDGRSDVYGVGVVLYQMLSGCLPFQVEGKDAIAIAVQHLTSQPERLRTYLPEVSIAVESVVMSTLEKELEKRPTATELAQRFRAAIEGQVMSSGPDVDAAVEFREDQPPSDDPAVDAEGDTATHRLPGPQTMRLAFSFADLLDPPDGSEAGREPVPTIAPKESGGTWT
ncbi:MAG: response regulator [Thermoanaerobaculia bacterium]|nr:response regulator [Thermoanaerobaculia bacterium]